MLFDPGEGTQRQMILAEVAASSITHICITHFHGDHCLGLPGVIQRISLDRVPHEVSVAFPGSGTKYYDRLRRASIFHNTAKLKAFPIDTPGSVTSCKAFEIFSLPLNHGAEAWGYRIQEADSVTMLPSKLAELGVTGRAIGDLKRLGSVEVDGRTVAVADVSVPKRGQSLAFVMDTRMCDSAFQLAAGVDLLVCEATYLESERNEAHSHGHLTAKQAARIAKESGARLLVLAHFSQRYTTTKQHLREAKSIFENTVLAKDLKRIPIPKRDAVEDAV